MTTRFVLIALLILDALAVVAALALFRSTGVDPFHESGFITVFSCLQLCLISALVFRIKKLSSSKRASTVWTIIALGFLFLAADEQFKLHESIDHRIHDAFNMQETGLTDRIDDVLVGLYGVVGIAVLIAYRDVFSAHRETFPYFVSGFILLFAMVALDLVTNTNDLLPLLVDPHRVAPVQTSLTHIEESLKIVAESLFAVAFYVIGQRVKSRGEGSVVRQLESVEG